MASDPNKFSQFWQELKRRKVVRVITVYAAAAFVVLELIDIVAPNLGLPAWTFNLVLILLLVGFVITVIVSWIYDIHPEGGIVKTEPAHKVKSEDQTKSSNSWKIASYISFVVIVGLIVLNIIPRSGKKEILDKSIAVLPFIDDSPDKDNEHIINGIMEDLLINLQSIKVLRVPGRTSTEQYRNRLKSIPEIAGELNVAYIVEGSGQRYGDKIRLRVQLVEGATDRHIWADSYDEVINGPEDIFRIQSQLAKSIAGELEAVITPEEKELIENVPTTSLTALVYYQEGRENYWKYLLHGDIAALLKAEGLYKKVLDKDPTFAQAYNGLAWVYLDEHGREEYLSESYLDSVFVLTNMALSHDTNLSETYVIRGRYYSAKNDFEQAINEYDKALRLNPNEWMAYWGKAQLYANIDNLQAMENIHQAIYLNRGKGLSLLLRNLSMYYFSYGFEKQGIAYLLQYLDLTGDSAFYYRMIANETNYLESREAKINMLKNSYRLDSSSHEVLYLIGEHYLLLGNYQESLKYFEKCIMLGVLRSNRYHRVGYAYWHAGDKDKADEYFNRQIEYGLAEINLGRQQAGSYYTYYDLAGTYAFRGEKSKAYEYLRMFNQKENIPLWMVKYIESDLLFDSIRNEPEFQQILADIEAKYQAEHIRVRQWLEEKDML